MTIKVKITHEGTPGEPDLRVIRGSVEIGYLKPGAEMLFHTWDGQPLTIKEHSPVLKTRAETVDEFTGN